MLSCFEIGRLCGSVCSEQAVPLRKSPLSHWPFLDWSQHSADFMVSRISPEAALLCSNLYSTQTFLHGPQGWLPDSRERIYFPSAGFISFAL